METGNHGNAHKFHVVAFIWGVDPETPSGIMLNNGMYLCRECCRKGDLAVEPPDCDRETDPTDPPLCVRCFKEIL